MDNNNGNGFNNQNNQQGYDPQTFGGQQANPYSQQTNPYDSLQYGQNGSQQFNQYNGNGYNQYNAQANYQSYNGNNNLGGIQRREIVMCIILSIVTCGIYGIYWMIKINDEVNYLSGEPMATTGGMVVLLTFVTCGIYGLYWIYKMGERVDRIKGDVNGNSAILFLILQIFGLAIVNYCLIQDTINKAVS